jgi:hypothetical protein
MRNIPWGDESGNGQSTQGHVIRIRRPTKVKEAHRRGYQSGRKIGPNMKVVTYGNRAIEPRKGMLHA